MYEALAFYILSFAMLCKQLTEIKFIHSFFLSESLTFQFWSSYIRMVEDLLTFIRATREADWGLHLSSVRIMLPWFFSYDRVNYSRYLSAYWHEMSNLQDTHPRTYTQVIVFLKHHE